jgi:GTP:adenosylcobinamide-phosphate guanylyltransferase
LFTVLVMAGSRATGDPLAVAAGATHKALVPVGGIPMLSRVLGALHAAQSVGRTVVCGLDSAVARSAVAETGALEFVSGGDTPAASATQAIGALGLSAPILITTADHALLVPEMVDEFCTISAGLDADVTFGVTAGAGVSAKFPGVHRTHYRFRDGGYCGCNLYALLSAKGLRAPLLWRRVEQHRKRPWRIIAGLGPKLLLRFLFGRVALADITPLVQRRFALRAIAVRLSDPAAGFDVDTYAQLLAAEVFLAQRQAGRPAD